MNGERMEGLILRGPEGYDGKTPEQIIMGMDRRMIPGDVINILPQIRTEFEPEAMQELADSIPLREKQGNTAYYTLMNSPTVAMLTEAEARVYVDEFNRVNEPSVPYDFDKLVPHETFEDTRYAILIAGERRMRAAPMRVKNDWGRDIPVSFDCSVLSGIGYLQALPLQFIENNARRRPSRVDEANAISKYIAAQRKVQPTFSKAACARAFGIPVSRVDDAEIFTGYPQCMQDLEKDFGYRTTVDARDIYELWKLYHDNRRIDARQADKEYLLVAADGATCFDSFEELAAYETRTCLAEIKSSALRHKRDPVTSRRITLDSIRQRLEAMVAQDNLFGGYGLDIVQTVAGVPLDETGDVGPVVRRRLVAEGLSNQILEGIRQLVALDVLTDDRKAKLAAYVASMLPADIGGSPVDTDGDALF